MTLLSSSHEKQGAGFHTQVSIHANSRAPFHIKLCIPVCFQICGGIWCAYPLHIVLCCKLGFQPSGSGNFWLRVAVTLQKIALERISLQICSGLPQVGEINLKQRADSKRSTLNQRRGARNQWRSTNDTMMNPGGLQLRASEPRPPYEFYMYIWLKPEISGQQNGPCQRRRKSKVRGRGTS